MSYPVGRMNDVRRSPTEVPVAENKSTTSTRFGGPAETRWGDRRGLADRSNQGLATDLEGLAQRLAAGTYELLLLVGEFDHRGGWAATGSLSCAAWLADVCGIELSTAHSQVRVARAMRKFALLDAAMACGDISYAKA